MAQRALHARLRNNLQLLLVVSIAVVCKAESCKCEKGWECSDGGTGDCFPGWQRVRHTPASLRMWHGSNDGLQGLDVYGNPLFDPLHWSVRFNHLAPQQFLFANGKCTRWLIANRSSIGGVLTGEYYDNDLRAVEASSENINPHHVRWHNREKGMREDPFISVIDYADAIREGGLLYGELGVRDHISFFLEDGGYDVYIPRSWFPCTFPHTCTERTEGECFDVDECLRREHNCDAASAFCINTPGSFACACNAGYGGTGTFCAPLDECANNGTYACNATVSCSYPAGSLVCECIAGFWWDGRHCTNKNTSSAPPCSKGYQPDSQCTEACPGYEFPRAAFRNGATWSTITNCPQCQSSHAVTVPVTSRSGHLDLGALTYGGNLTYSMRVYAIDTHEWTRAFYFGDVESHTFHRFAFQPDGRFVFHASPGTIGGLMHVNPLAPFRWVHIAVTLEIKSGFTEGRMYIDGQEATYVADTLHVASDGDSLVIIDPPQQPTLPVFDHTTCLIGKNEEASDNWRPTFSGSIADFQIYRRPLSAVEVLSLSSGNLNYSAADIIPLFPCDSRRNCDKCADTDECSGGLDTCNENAGCKNTRGSFTCACNAGWESSDAGVTCSNVDECVRGLANCDHPRASCTDSEGSFACACNAGYSSSDAGATCVNVDECATGVHSCDAASAECTDAAGSFACACAQGWEGDGATCMDVDECAAGLGSCSLTASCHNTNGSFTCACFEGSGGDGIVCFPTSRVVFTATVQQPANSSLENSSVATYVLVVAKLAGVEQAQVAVQQQQHETARRSRALRRLLASSPLQLLTTVVVPADSARLVADAIVADLSLALALKGVTLLALSEVQLSDTQVKQSADIQGVSDQGESSDTDRIVGAVAGAFGGLVLMGVIGVVLRKRTVSKKADVEQGLAKPQILGFFSNSGTGEALDVHGEAQAMAMLLRQSKSFATTDMNPQPTAEIFHEAVMCSLSRNVKIIHMAGHGEKEGLCFMSDELEASPTPCDPEFVARTIGAVSVVRGGPVECVVLNACNTERTALLLRENGVQHVVCWKWMVQDSIAKLFTVGFYTALDGIMAESASGQISGNGYYKAFEAGRAAILQVGEGTRSRTRAYISAQLEERESINALVLLSEHGDVREGRV